MLQREYHFLTHIKTHKTVTNKKHNLVRYFKCYWWSIIYDTEKIVAILLFLYKSINVLRSRFWLFWLRHRWDKLKKYIYVLNPPSTRGNFLTHLYLHNSKYMNFTSNTDLKWQLWKQFLKVILLFYCMVNGSLFISIWITTIENFMRLSIKMTP